jgi:hypothetical protein
MATDGSPEMPRALWLLQWLGLRSAVRRALRNLRTVKGLLSTGCMVLGCGMCLSSWVLSSLLGKSTEGPVGDFSLSLEQVERHGSLVLLALCLLTAVKTTGKGAIVAFAPAEVVFLVAGPFSRRQLLSYKFLQLFLVFAMLALGPAILLSAFGSIFSLPPGPWPARYLGILLTLLFLKLLADGLTSIALIIGVRAYNLWRRVALWGVVALASASLLYLVATGPDVGWSEALDHLEAMPLAHAVLQVPRVFLRAALSERFWPDFALWGGVCLAIDGILFWLVIQLDAINLEAAAAEGERIHARIERIRAGAPVVLGQTAAKPRAMLPDLPRWGGIGPLAWRHMQSVVRRRSLLSLFILLPMGEFFLGNFLIQQMQGQAGAEADLQVLPLAGLLMLLSLLVPAIYSHDFRRDYDRMEVFKTLPIRSANLVLGQILTPVLCSAIMQTLGVFALVMAGAHTPAAILVLGSALYLGIPLSCLGVLLDNMVFLLSPSRPIPAPGAQFSGLKILLNVGKVLVLYLACGIAGGVGTATYFLAGKQFWLASIVAGLMLGCFAAALVPLAALLFRRFDVARERPA